jgi:prepilin-type processing-associated H-X9-DG protein
VAPGDGRNGPNPTYSQWTTPIQQSRVKTVICPSDYTQSGNNDARASYGINGQLFRHNFNWGVGLSMYPSSMGNDGTSNTIFWTDKLARGTLGCYADNFWPDWGPIITSRDNPGGCGDLVGVGPSMFQTNPAGNPASNIDGRRASSPHGNGINVGLGDGSVRFISSSVAPATWWALMTPNAGDNAGGNW